MGLLQVNCHLTWTPNLRNLSIKDWNSYLVLILRGSVIDEETLPCPSGRL